MDKQEFEEIMREVRRLVDVPGLNLTARDIDTILRKRITPETSSVVGEGTIRLTVQREMEAYYSRHSSDAETAVRKIVRQELASCADAPAPRQAVDPETVARDAQQARLREIAREELCSLLGRLSDFASALAEARATPLSLKDALRVVAETHLPKAT